MGWRLLWREAHPLWQLLVVRAAGLRTPNPTEDGPWLSNSVARNTDTWAGQRQSLSTGRDDAQNPGDVMPTDIPAPVCPGSSLELPPPVTLTFPTILRVPRGRDSKEAQRSGLEQVSGCGERGCQGRNRPAAQTEQGSFGLWLPDLPPADIRMCACWITLIAVT